MILYRMYHRIIFFRRENSVTGTTDYISAHSIESETFIVFLSKYILKNNFLFVSLEEIVLSHSLIIKKSHPHHRYSQTALQATHFFEN